jgi:hypothetical protein
MEIVFENNEIKVEKSTYNNGRLKLVLVDKIDNYHQAISIDPNWVKVNKNQVIVRDYGETKGIYQFLLQKNIVSSSKRNVSVGINTAIACEIL